MTIRLSILLSLSLFFVTSSQADECDWKPLFDGKTLDGWVQRGGQDKFDVVDGCIVGTNYTGVGNGFMCTKKSYRDFELTLDFHCPDKTNSGIQIRSQIKQRKGRKDTVWGYQVEIDPSDRSWTGGIQEELGRAWLVNLKDNPEGQKAFKHNDWNHFRILAVGDRMQVWLNGVPTADLKDSRTPEGFIGLQLHWPVVKRGAKPGTQVKWKNLCIREITPVKPAPAELQTDQPETVSDDKPDESAPADEKATGQKAADE